MISLFVAIVPRIWIEDYEKTQSWMISSTIVWLLFVILESYYGGAMTMFFTSEVTVPLDSLADVLEAYPTWKLKFLDGYQMMFQGAMVPKVLCKLQYNTFHAKCFELIL